MIYCPIYQVRINRSEQAFRNSERLFSATEKGTLPSAFSAAADTAFAFATTKRLVMMSGNTFVLFAIIVYHKMRTMSRVFEIFFNHRLNAFPRRAASPLPVRSLLQAPHGVQNKIFVQSHSDRRAWRGFTQKFAFCIIRYKILQVVLFCGIGVGELLF